MVINVLPVGIYFHEVLLIAPSLTITYISMGAPLSMLKKEKASKVTGCNIVVLYYLADWDLRNLRCDGLNIKGL